MKSKSKGVGHSRRIATKSAPPVVAGTHRRGYHVVVTQATERNGETTVEEIRVVPKELYSPERLPRVHDSSAYDAAISNLCRGDQGYRLTVDRGPGQFQVELPPTEAEIDKIQELVKNLGLDPALKQTICHDLALQAEARRPH